MYTNEIIDFLKLKKMSRLVTVVASDRLPIKMNNNRALIVNLSPSYESGSHWVAIHLDETGLCSYFCSFGTRPTIHSIQRFLKFKCRNVKFSDKCLQQVHSEICGQYVCVFLAYVLLYNYEMKDFLKLFSNNATLNDFLIQKLYRRLTKFNN